MTPLVSPENNPNPSPNNIQGNPALKRSLSQPLSSPLSKPLSSPLPTQVSPQTSQPINQAESALIKILKKSKISTGSTINPNINERARNLWVDWEISEEEKKRKSELEKEKKPIDIERHANEAVKEVKVQEKVEKIKKRVRLFQSGVNIVTISTVFSVVILVLLIIINKDSLPWLSQDGAKAVTPRGYLRNIKAESLSFFTKQQLTDLGVYTLPDDFEIQEKYKDIKIIRTQSTSFSQRQLSLIKYLINNSSETLLTSGPINIVIFSPDKDPIPPFYDPNSIQMYASGNYMYFNEKSFDQPKAISSRSLDSLYRRFNYELTHIAQFNNISKSLDEVALRKELEKGKNWVELSTNTPFISEFAVVSGWRIDSQQGKYFLEEKDSKTSELGKVSIQEDMAESVAGILMGEFDQFSEGRKAWVMKYLNITEEEILQIKLPRNELTERGNLTNVSVDFTKIDQYLENYDMVDKQIFISDVPGSCNKLRDLAVKTAPERGWTGSFSQQTTRDNVVKYIGVFDTELNRDVYAEIQSYENSQTESPADCVVIVYSAYMFEQ